MVQKLGAEPKGGGGIRGAPGPLPACRPRPPGCTGASPREQLWMDRKDLTCPVTWDVPLPPSTSSFSWTDGACIPGYVTLMLSIYQQLAPSVSHHSVSLG